jgi:hypothetical protein
MKAILYSVNEEGKEFSWSWILSFNTNLFHEYVFAFKSNNVSFIFWNETWNFTCSKHTVECFKESLRLNVRISHNETNLKTFWSCIGIEILDIFFKLVISIGFGKSNLEWKSLEADEATESSQTLFS